MNNIKTVTIFESWVQVAETLNNEQKGEFYHAIMRYALYGEEPELTPPLDAFFSLVRPVIDKSNNRKIAGAKGGKNKQNSSKTQAKFKQNASKTQASDEANFKQAFKQTIKQNASEEEEEEEEEEEVKGENIIAPACEKIVKNFPKEGIRDFRKAVYAAINAVRYQLDLPGATVESAIEVVENGVLNYANAVNSWSFEEKRFIKDAEKFFNESHYLTDPVKWQSRKENDTHRKPTGYDWRNPDTWGEE
jgi:hypothetical protein